MDVNNQLTELLAELKGMRKQIPDVEPLTEEQKRLAGQIAELQEKQLQMVKRQDDIEKAGAKFGGAVARTVGGSLGAQFVNSKQYQEMVKRDAVACDAVVLSRKEDPPDMTVDTDAAGDWVMPDRRPGVIRDPDRPLTIRDMLPTIPTTSNAIEYVVETGFTNSAALVDEGAEKPESTLAFDLETVPVCTIAHWIPATRQILADAPGLRAYIDTRLRYGLRLAEEDELLYGDDCFDGFFEAEDVQDVETNDGSILDHIRQAKLEVRNAEYAPTAIVMHPTDWANIEMLKDGVGNYRFANPVNSNRRQLWGLPVIETTAINEGNFLMGAFNMGAAIFDREQVTVRVSEHHEEFFTHNKVAILCESRMTLAIFRPEAFVIGEFDYDADTVCVNVCEEEEEEGEG